MTRIKLLLLAACIAPSVHATEKNIDANFLYSMSKAQRIVYSLHPSKPGQARVFAIDGSEYSASMALWMKGQLHDAEIAVAHDDKQAAVSHMQQVARVLKNHSTELASDVLFARYTS